MGCPAERLNYLRPFTEDCQISFTYICTVKIKGLILLLLFLGSQASVCACDLFNSIRSFETLSAQIKHKEVKSHHAEKFLADEITEEKSETEFTKKLLLQLLAVRSIFGFQRFNIEPSAPRGPDAPLAHSATPIYLLVRNFRI
jgi:hypothetical protein